MNAAEQNPSSNHLKTQWSRILIYVLLLLLFIAAVQDKNYLYSTREAYHLPDDAGAFWTEAAFHYRHARMVKDGIGIPSLDKQIQYPEGIEFVIVNGVITVEKGNNSGKRAGQILTKS